jgi:YHS domain-containing protein
MIRLLIVLILFSFVVRAISRLIGGVIEGLNGPPSSTRTPARSVPMVRDPVCGTFLLPERAVTLLEGRRPVYFCSERCRDQYRARTA